MPGDTVGLKYRSCPVIVDRVWAQHSVTVHNLCEYGEPRLVSSSSTTIAKGPNIIYQGEDIEDASAFLDTGTCGILGGNCTVVTFSLTESWGSTAYINLISPNSFSEAVSLSFYDACSGIGVDCLDPYCPDAVTASGDTEDIAHCSNTDDPDSLAGLLITWCPNGVDTSPIESLVPSSQTPTPTPVVSTSKLVVGPIVGGVVGSVVGIAIIILIGMIWWRLKLRSKKTTISYNSLNVQKSTELPGKKNDETANILSVPPAPPVYTPSVGLLYAHTSTPVEGVPKTDSSKNSYKTAPESPPKFVPGAPHSTGRGVTFVSSVPPSPRGMRAVSRRDAIDQTNDIVTRDHSRHRIVHARTHNPRDTHALPTGPRDPPLPLDNPRPEPVAAESHATPELGFPLAFSTPPFDGRDRLPMQCGPADIPTSAPFPPSAMPMPPLASHNGGRIPVFPLTHFPMPLHTDHQGAQVGLGVGQHPLASNGGTARRGRVLQRRNGRSPPGNRTFSPKTNHYAPTSVEGTHAHGCV